MFYATHQHVRITRTTYIFFCDYPGCSASIDIPLDPAESLSDALDRLQVMGWKVDKLPPWEHHIIRTLCNKH